MKWGTQYPQNAFKNLFEWSTFAKRSLNTEKSIYDIQKCGFPSKVLHCGGPNDYKRNPQ